MINNLGLASAEEKLNSYHGVRTEKSEMMSICNFKKGVANSDNFFILLRIIRDLLELSSIQKWD